MEKDCCFIKGNSHNVCEDYATVGDNCVIVSDGCSSSKNTDVGARVLSLITKGVLETKFKVTLNKDVIMNKLEHMKYYDMFKDVSFDATLLYVLVVDNKIDVACYGDGFMIFEYTDNTTDVYKMSNEFNAPFYLSYDLDQERKKEYIKEYGNEVLIDKTFNFNSDKESISTEKYCDNVEHTIDKYLFKAVHILSDGVESFSKINEDGKKENIHYTDVLKKLLDFKSYKGEFVKRRINGFQKFCKKNNWEHYDDLSLASIYFGEN